jgi:hypothetical protein
MSGVRNAALAADLVERLNEFRKQVESAWPDNCCPKGIMRESNGRETVCCVDDCPWMKMQLTIATAMVDAEILAKRMADVEKAVAAWGDETTRPTPGSMAGAREWLRLRMPEDYPWEDRKDDQCLARAIDLITQDRKTV